ncbi:MAG: bile acid:sodium symporter family protein [Verrucomicrobia bacterium]|nr:bile acid:sodium symporter family protein [Verrucomicrobiota bacterium]MCH8514312.1 bile acid:sodium symporter family protein [Kiritimatiellia bacterium]
MDLKTVLLPIALIIIMFGMGMTLTPADFKRVILAPKAKLLGLLNQLLLLPLIALGLVFAFRLPGELAVGLMLIAACPGGPTSNIISHLSKGDTALSVTLTAVSSVITVFTIPLVVGAAMGHFLEPGQIPPPYLTIMLQLIVVTILPISLGMLLHAKKPAFCAKSQRAFNILSVLFLALVIVGAVLEEENLGQQFRDAGPAAIALNLLTMATGFGTAALLRLPRRQQITISIESGIQNGTLALGIAQGILNIPGVSVPAVVYSLLMFGSGALMILVAPKILNEA